MNWDIFIVHNDSYENAFETLCNQLFENWIKENYSSKIKLFRTVNGAGGDGGVESYAIMNSGDCIGLQAKWFITSMDNSQISQIERSINTAKSVRPEIIKYIVCIPRNLSPKKANTKNPEEQKWDDMVARFELKFPDLEIVLWDNQSLLNELQKPQSIGIYKFWFKNTELFFETINDSFIRSKDSWLKTRYVPELHLSGMINNKVFNMLGTIENKKILLNKLEKLNHLCYEVMENSEQLIDALGDKLQELTTELNTFINDIKIIYNKNQEIIEFIIDEQEYDIDFEETIYYLNFRNVQLMLNVHKNTFRLYSHFNDVISILDDLYEYDFDDLLQEIKESLNKNAILFLGEPGTGKTHGVASITENILENKHHIPILINAKSASDKSTWKDIIINTLRLSVDWDEAEIWQALSTLAYTNKISNFIPDKEINILPKVIILVDAIDESNDYDSWKQRIQEVNYIMEKYPMIRFVFTSRPFVFADDDLLENINNIYLNSDGDVSTFKLYEKYADYYNVKVTNKNLIKYSLNTPFALKLFCELNKDKTIDTTNREDITVNNLIREKIKKAEKEYSKKYSISENNQYIYKSIKIISNVLKTEKEIEWNELISILSEKLSLDRIQAENILTFLKNYGIVGSYSVSAKSILDEEKNCIFKGIQGYFDYITAEIILNEYKHPSEINFYDYTDLDQNAIYSLSSLSMQRYDYLLTQNTSIESVISEYQITKIQFFALRNTNIINAKSFVDRTKAIISKNSDGLFTIINELVLPLARCSNHPLGIPLLDEYLLTFEKPAQRDIIWSYYGYIKSKKEDRWFRYNDLDLDNPDYVLNADDQYDGLPIFYVWTLSGLNNKIRENSRNELLKWAISSPNEYIKLFYKFANCNDPQIVEEMYSILMCCLFECLDKRLIKEIGDWIIKNVLNIECLDHFRNISIRYYCINILKKAIMMKIYTEESIKSFLPPYELSDININLNIEALSGCRMSGYKCIDYDLSRYVLVDHFDSYFEDYGGRNNSINDFLNEIKKKNEKYENLSFEKFIISVAYQYVLDMGWTEKEFFGYKDGETYYYGFDSAIKSVHYPASHGTKSKVMTVCEKYVWQARNMISGFLSDRLLTKIDNEWKKLEKYEMLENFYIPSQDLNLIDPHNIPIENNLYFPEIAKIKFEKKEHTILTLSDEILNSPDIDCEKWLIIDNNTKLFKVEDEKLLVLYNYFNYIDKNGIDTVILINSLIVDSAQLNLFINKIKGNKQDKQSYLCPSDWSGYIESSCYITPKEVCWFPWINRLDPYEIEELEINNVFTGTDKCTYNNDDYGDVHYIIPSLIIRNLLNIKNSNGYIYENEKSKVVAEFYLAGKMHKNYQQTLIIKEEIINKLLNKNKTIVWLFREYRRGTIKSREKLGDFYAEKCVDYIVYYENGNFIKEKISEIRKNR